ncbi:COPII coat Sec23p-Sfb3p heterodimer component [Mycoemilia scoparia]|uniref:COPII coat Sec23p-Sfb3p heterodimer component n=1 Tax=Mycoemilia scoparia TaxID=417184 RepID=A0A9W8DSE7_9FUNG|nr:COPII coat Sec23p-Sfb3p heterodimer component [Mycoemilia scoparia]
MSQGQQQQRPPYPQQPPQGQPRPPGTPISQQPPQGQYQQQRPQFPPQSHQMGGGQIPHPQAFRPPPPRPQAGPAAASHPMAQQYPQSSTAFSAQPQARPQVPPTSQRPPAPPHGYPQVRPVSPPGQIPSPSTQGMNSGPLPNVNGLASQMGQMQVQDMNTHHKSKPRRVYPTDPSVQGGIPPSGSPGPLPPHSSSGAIRPGPLGMAGHPPMPQPPHQPPQNRPPMTGHSPGMHHPQQSQMFTPATSFAPGTPSYPHPQQGQRGSIGGMPPQMQQQQQQPAPAEPSRPRIDPEQMPSPVAVHANDQKLFDNEPFITSQKTGVPLASTKFRAIDEGNCNPRFMRMSTYNIPFTEELAKTSQIPIAMVVQPLAQIHDDETPIQVVDFGEEGPIRCARCKTYINPYFVFVNSGKSFVCNICRHENDVPSDYFCNLDLSGRRLDWDVRPELRHGSIEFLATKDFISRPPMPASYIFAIDVSWQSVQSKLIESATKAIKSLLFEGPGIPDQVKIGLITYDRHVHFYNLSASLDQAQMLTVPDIDDIFVPLHDGFLVDPFDSKEVIEDILDRIPSLFANNRTAESTIGAVVPAVYEALKGKGGKLFAFQTSRPVFGPGTLDDRSYTKLINTENEKKLYNPNTKYYSQWAEKYVDEGISASFYLFPSAFTDVATIGELCNITGGEMQVYPNFNIDRDSTKFTTDLHSEALRPFGSNGVLRIRCSDGLRVDKYLGGFFMRNHVDIELGGITSETSIGATFNHDEKLDEKQDVYFQVALLYTTSDGQRRIRVHNLALPCTTLVGNLFRHAEMDTSINIAARLAVDNAKREPLKDIRRELSENCIKVLTAYRRNCASGSSPSQLILPEAYKLMPLYTLSLLKSMALREGGDTNIDLRVHHMHLLNRISVDQSVTYFYPRIAPVHNLEPGAGEKNQRGQVNLPPLVRASYSRLDPSGIYILEAQKRLYMWIGSNATQKDLTDIFGAASPKEVNPHLTTIPERPNDTSRKVAAIMGDLQYPRACTPGITIVRQGLDRSEGLVASLLTEDQNNGGLSYSDYLCFIHRQIQQEVSKA